MLNHLWFFSDQFCHPIQMEVEYDLRDKYTPHQQPYFVYKISDHEQSIPNVDRNCFYYPVESLLVLRNSKKINKRNGSWQSYGQLRMLHEKIDGIEWKEISIQLHDWSMKKKIAMVHWYPRKTNFNLCDNERYSY